ncbi:hypothetical protein [Vibrio owensii]|uniref:hypothetical protein n=1 Tax=Vibrio harveyi group TaxID=717610 RepID=UPI003CC543C6
MSFHKDLESKVAGEFEERIQEKAQQYLEIETQNELKQYGSVKPGFLDNPWNKLLNLWINNRISNVVISDSLRKNVVPSFICDMDYQESLRNTNESIAA